METKICIRGSKKIEVRFLRPGTFFTINGVLFLAVNSVNSSSRPEFCDAVVRIADGLHVYLKDFNWEFAEQLVENVCITGDAK